MSDDTDARDDGFEPDLADIEALLRELDVDDLEGTETPAGVWDGIARSLAEESTTSAEIVPLAHRRALRLRWMLAAAAAVVAVAIAGIVVVGRGGDSDTLVSTAQLEFEDGFDPLGSTARARAELLERDGHYEIRLADADLPLVADADLELWLIETDPDGNIVDVAPVSKVDAGSPGAYRVPDELDPASHPIVDISIEPRDGDDTHSGRSILRGTLAST